MLGADGKPRDLNGDSKITDHDRVALPPTDVVKNPTPPACFVHPYTFRSETPGLLSDTRATPKAEYQLPNLRTGCGRPVQQLPDTAVSARTTNKHGAQGANPRP